MLRIYSKLGTFRNVQPKDKKGEHQIKEPPGDKLRHEGLAGSQSSRIQTEMQVTTPSLEDPTNCHHPNLVRSRSAHSWQFVSTKASCLATKDCLACPPAAVIPPIIPPVALGPPVRRHLSEVAIVMIRSILTAIEKGTKLQVCPSKSKAKS